MMVSRTSRRAALIAGGMVLVTCGCNRFFDIPSNVLINSKTMNIPHGGGSVELMFAGIAGQQILITLTGRIDGMVPYAQLIAPNGGSTTVPEARTSQNGVNSGQATLAQTGAYSLVVYDNARVGGGVTIRVELVR